MNTAAAARPEDAFRNAPPFLKSLSFNITFNYVCVCVGGRTVLLNAGAPNLELQVCGPPDVGAGMNPGLSEEQQVVLTADSSLLPSFLSSYILS